MGRSCRESKTGENYQLISLSYIQSDKSKISHCKISGFLNTERSALNMYYENKEKTKAEISGGYAERIALARIINENSELINHR